MGELWTALTLVAIIEGLLLFALPGAWKRAMQQLQQLSDEQLRRVGAAVLIAGLVSLYLVRGAGSGCCMMRRSRDRSRHANGVECARAG